MPISNFPDGFANGVNIRGFPRLDTHAGNVFWVDSGGGTASDSNRGTFDRPLATIDAAVGLCTASNGDIIVVKPGHTEAITTNDQIDVDVVGVTIICMGSGDARPTFTWSGTDATACIAMAAADTAWYGGVFVSSDAGDDITGMVRIEADDVELSTMEFREGTGQPEAAVLISDALARVHIHHCKFTSLTNGAAANDAAISFSDATSADSYYIHDNYIHGTYDQAGIWCSNTTAATSAITDFRIMNNVIINTATSLYAIDLGTTNPGTGVIGGNIVETDAEATSIRRNGLTLANNTWALDAQESLSPGLTTGAPLVSVKTNLAFSHAEQAVAEVDTGPVMVTGMVMVATAIAEAEAETEVFFDNVTTTSAGNLYAAAQEVDVTDEALEVGEHLVLGSAGVVNAEIAVDTEDNRGLNWIIQAGDNIVWDGAGAQEAGETGQLIISYVSLGGELEIE